MFAVVLVLGDELGAYFICRKTTIEDGVTDKSIEIEAHKTPFQVSQRDAVIELLVKAGLTVRFYDPEEKKWMDNSLIYGYVPAPGSRDGRWGPPTNVAEFEDDYLSTV